MLDGIFSGPIVRTTKERMEKKVCFLFFQNIYIHNLELRNWGTLGGRHFTSIMIPGKWSSSVYSIGGKAYLNCCL